MLPVLSLSRAVGRTYAPEPDDAENTKRTLNQLGFYQAPSWGLTRFADKALFDGLKAFQKENDLKTDGIMKPGGPTEQALNVMLRERSVHGPGSVHRADYTQVADFGGLDEKGSILNDLGLHHDDINRPDARFRNPIVGAPDHSANAPPDAVVEEDEQEPKWEPFKELDFTDGGPNRTYITKGPIKVERRSFGYGFDASRFLVNWHPLDKDGKLQTIFANPDNHWKEYGGHTLPLGGVLRNTIEPPYQSRYGFRVTIQVPPQAKNNGNTPGVFFRVYKQKEDPERANELK